MIEKIEKLKVYFEKADKSNSGTISPDEFLACCDETICVKLSKDTRSKGQSGRKGRETTTDK